MVQFMVRNVPMMLMFVFDGNFVMILVVDVYFTIFPNMLVVRMTMFIFLFSLSF
jgi:hypothetical protein